MNSSSSMRNELDPDRMPKHVAVIMDGNGRWAKKRLLNRLKGHEKGAQAVRTVVQAARKLDIEALTLYAFSTENWQRPQSEVSGLMFLLRRFLETERQTLMENDIRLNTIGQTDRLPEAVRKDLKAVMAETATNKKMVLTLALSYGARAEIVDMVRQIAAAAKEGTIDPSAVTPDMVANHLYTRELPDPDLLIRTSGEMRISNFLLWQIAYAEIFFTPTLWPDFGEEEFIRILKDYQQRERRFGAIPSG
ncbi:isoprenyl transferase [Desulfosarcina widdelii]|uniref:Isoprenyl transferase n=1 Tax=Desulfosarcina widdelii TaxID=947919 RepID=A0A5K7ZEN5_9BACT|nr:isoprenyl transferase [Desulfosarcina widdelii]BBO79290.1 isoprenyl transferase [Desulfosarcina widdelii]